ncbi:amino acid permease [Gemella sp. GH3]|uniref:amino acid permease n=1 Tax=unclassified Gemella TaxID=2624949 RepID=UPI0015D004D0|nr:MULTISPECIES: amino acid permease [unclassified Gemella]MBF0713776.1 amino acid permease [Gemella sp. GH3.1]NYS50728.1 amino acid permease [Gemella sp. GH3]
MVHKKMRRNLSSRHVSMMAIGGSIGTGIFMATGSMVSQAGSYISVAAYTFIGIFVYFLMSGVGELASFYPVSGSFSSYAERFVDPALGFALGWLYWLMWILVAGIDIITLSRILQFWDFFQQFSVCTLKLFFLLILLIINITSVKIFGEVEYWLTTIKVLTVVVFLIVGVSVIFGILGDNTYGLNTFVANAKGNSLQGFLGLFGILSTAAFSFGGTESVAITSGESQDPKNTIPKAVNKVFWRILLFYVGTIFIIASVVSVTDERLLNTSSVLASPFTIVFENAGFLLGAAVMNAVICSSVISAGNSGIYFASRQLFSLSTRGLALKQFSKLSTNSVPNLAVFISVIFIILSFIFEHYNSAGYYMLLSLVGIVTICVWIVAILAQIRLRKAIVKQNRNLEELLPYQAKFGLTGSYIALCVFITLIFLQIYSDIILKGFLASLYNLLPVIIIVAIYFGYKVVNKTQIIKLEKINLDKNFE